MRDGVVIWFAVGSIGLAAAYGCGGGSDNGARDTASGASNAGGNSSGGNAAGGTSGSSTGGSTSGSGGSSGGSGGGLPACNPTAGPAKGDGTNTAIDEIDDTDIMFETAGVGMGAWDFSKDASTGTITPANTAALMPEAGGQSGSALHVMGSGLTGWGAALGAFLNGAASAFDASAYGGVAFYIKGTSNVQEGENKVMVMARMPDVLPGPGSCCSDAVMGGECYSSHRATIDIPADWTEVKLPWSSFARPAWGLGSTMDLDPSRIRDITFSFNHDMMNSVPADGASFDVWIDGLRFMTTDEMVDMGAGGMPGAGGTPGGEGGAGATPGEGGAGGG